MTQAIGSALGTLQGVGEIRDKDGNLKSTFVFETQCTPEQADRLARDISMNRKEDDDNGSNSR